ncbi:MAG: DUF3618 domain-containing protein [Angustibacter sp.]
MTTSSDPDQIRADIARTRAELSRDVDSLTEQVHPKNVARRGIGKVTGRATSLKDRVMGSSREHAAAGRHAVTSSVSGSVGSAAHSVSSAAGSVRGAVSDAPDQITARTQGNPLAAGLIAFGLGALVSSLLPISEEEKRAAATAKDRAAPLADEIGSAVKDAAEQMKEPAQQAAQSVKRSASDAATAMKDHSGSVSQDLRASASHDRGAADPTRPVPEQQSMSEQSMSGRPS